MREVILKAVANPPKILWGPFLPVMMNLGIQFPLLFMLVGTANVSPLLPLCSIIIAHTICVFIGAKEPHISGMILAAGQTSKNTTNLYKVKGKKFAP